MTYFRVAVALLLSLIARKPPLGRSGAAQGDLHRHAQDRVFARPLERQASPQLRTQAS